MLCILRRISFMFTDYYFNIFLFAEDKTLLLLFCPTAGELTLELFIILNRYEGLKSSIELRTWAIGLFCPIEDYCSYAVAYS